MVVTLNRKEYQEDFEEFHHEEYFNLKIYPEAARIEQEAGLLSELVEMFKGDCTLELLGASEFLIDNVPSGCSGKHVITYLNGEGEFNGKVLLGMENTSLDSMYKCKLNIQGLEKVLYFDDDALILEHFKYYKIENNILYFDNLVCLCMIVKNAGPGFEKVLVDNMPNFDKWCILDTGSTDGTQDVIKRVLAGKKGSLYEEPFVNFKVSRNRCFELAGKSCKFLLTLDDTYIVQGNLKSFLSEVRGDQFSDSFSMMIRSGDSEYYSNRIIKSLTGLRYIHTIHEVIPKENNMNVTVPNDKAIISDERSDYMENRTTTRKQFDLDLLFQEFKDDPGDPRALYYIAQTYGCMGDEVNKAKYFELRLNHPEEGYIQEKVDACFELARTYNFKLGRDWETCEALYQKAYELDPERPDSVYFIGIHWYLQGNHALAYQYFKKGFEIGYPIHKQYSLKPTLSFHFLPKFLTEVCYSQGDSVLGESSARFYLENNREDRDIVSSWHSIHSNINKMGPLAKVPIKSTSDIFCIVADGGWSEWSGKDILTNGVGGSETWVIEMARNIKINNPYLTVIVFCKCKEPESFEGVGYNPLHMFHTFVANNIIHTCLISRYTEYVPVALKGYAMNVGIIFHDILGMDTVIPVHPKIKWFFCLTDWHSRYIASKFPQFANIVKTLNYGVNPKFTSGAKVKNSFIYSSFPNRGLVVLLNMWPRIHEKFPDSVLHLYCDVDGKWVNDVAPDEMNAVRHMLTTNAPGVIYHGWVNKEELSKAWETAEYWLYPCKFEETFCLTALEAAASKTFAVTNNLAALGETVGDRGLIVHGSPLDQGWQDEMVSKLSEYMSGSKSKDELVEKNYQWSQTLSWNSQAKKLDDFTKFKTHWWKNKDVNDYLLEQTKDLKTVLDFGCGPTSPGVFENATITVDKSYEATYCVDFEKEQVPIEQVDFVYCRHTIEDLINPGPALQEIKRLSNRGYIETPSVIVECSLGVDSAGYQGRGYRHHRSFVWTDINTGTLMILPKFPIVEHIFTFDDDVQMKSYLEDPIIWNTYHLFDESKPLHYKVLEYEVDFTFETYLSILKNAIHSTLLNTISIKKLVFEKLDYCRMLNWTTDSVARGNFLDVFKKLPENPKVLEVGTFVGTSVIEILRNTPGSTATVIDSWVDYEETNDGINTNMDKLTTRKIEETFYSNVKRSGLENRVKVLKGTSYDRLLELVKQDALFDFIYIDGSHKCLDVYVDACLAWKLLKPGGGVIVFDDFLFNKGDTLNSPNDALVHFMDTFKGQFTVLFQNYRLFLRRN